jgi:SPOR domain
VIWWLGTQYQSADAKAKTAVEHVKLSISIIEDQNQADPALLEWATTTLNFYSQVKFSQPLAEAIASGQANVSAAATGGGWFAVVGSLHSSAAATDLIAELRPALPDDLRSLAFEVHQTDINDLFALTIGGETSKSDALARAARIREAGLVPDAYAQRNRGWEKQAP